MFVDPDLTYEQMGELRQLLLMTSYKRADNKTASSCTGKHGFASYDQALLTGARKTFGDVMRPYRCNVCHKWHVAQQKDHYQKAHNRYLRRD